MAKSNRTPCYKCKHFGEKVNERAYDAHVCKLHGCEVNGDAMGCEWANKNDANCGGLKETTFANPEHVFLWEGQKFLRVAYWIAEYAGWWFYGEDINARNYGWHGRPCIWGHAYETREECERDAQKTILDYCKRHDEDDITEKVAEAIMDNRQLSLF